MLTELRVRNLAVIEDVTLRLGHGLNVLSGETGAGKSLLVDALALLLGERASADLIRTGAECAVVEAAFEGFSEDFADKCDATGVDVEDGRFVIRREINSEGRNRAWANGSPVTVSVLATLAGGLVDLHGQHEAQSLLKSASQRAMIDAFGKAGKHAVLVRSTFQRLDEARRQLATLTGKLGEVRKRADYLKHVTGEISAAELKGGEDEALAVEAKRLGNVERLTALASELAEVLDGEADGALQKLSAAGKMLDELSQIDETVERWRELFNSVVAEVDELARSVRDYGSGVETDPERLREVEERRDLIFRLCQKYGSTIEEVLRTGEEARAELEVLDTADFDIASLNERIGELERDIQKAADDLTERRSAAAQELSAAVNKLLPALGMEGAELIVELRPVGGTSSTGNEDVEFTVRLNVGHEARPLAKVASGGELSRIMLALKTVLAREDSVPTLVFDEVDQGIGGDVAHRVAEALREIGETRQVLVITHLPPIAAKAAHHMRVVKSPEGGVATSGVAELDGEERVSEVARMLGSSDDPVVRRHASDLIGRKQTASV